MGRGRYALVAGLLLVLSVERVRPGQGSCPDCPAGTFCGKSRSPACAPCPPHSFSRSPGQEACQPCRRCEGVFRTKRPCSPTSDAECECGPGLRCRGPGCAQCEPDCGPGREPAAHGCRDCDPGTFNDQKLGTCRPWTDCARDGKAVLVNGTKERDAVCGPRPAGVSPGAPSAPAPTPEPAPEPAFLKPVRTAQEEDGCSCGFPEEEEGEEGQL
uniref:TNF receptor superfamily member 9 n=1 Tax=Pipistrellus kuhlii TaxID=59472 RepID=A0A7J7T239_PIPKU|nr:TNF receptor superfamily member 9 [Pipistrellus kuhlii]